MSRYVDLDGLTWDGKPISSKIQEVKTKIGYMQGITVGWLWGDNVPHIDLAEHDKEVRTKVIEEALGNMNQISYNIQDADDLFMKICDILEQMKGKQNE